MVSNSYAESVILDSCRKTEEARTSLSKAPGKVLRREVRATRDGPPCDRVMMDGYALSEAVLRIGKRRFRIDGVQPAGASPLEIADGGGCIEVGTGASLPRGCDRVIPVESVRVLDGEIQVDEAVSASDPAWVHRAGSDFREGAVLLAPGRRIGSREAGILASCGQAFVQVSRPVRVAVLSTGNELVAPGEPVKPHQVYESNRYAVEAALGRVGIEPVMSARLADDADTVGAKLGEALASADAVLMIGGVSGSRWDPCSAALASLNVRVAFRGVRQRPGHPFTFGVGTGGQSVFGLPGNPLSALVCLHRYVIPALGRMEGLDPAKEEWVALAEPAAFTGEMAWHLPVRLDWASDVSSVASRIPRAVPVPYNTSGDFASVAGTDGWVELPPEPDHFPEGTVARFYRWL